MGFRRLAPENCDLGSENSEWASASVTALRLAEDAMHSDNSGQLPGKQKGTEVCFRAFCVMSVFGVKARRTIRLPNRRLPELRPPGSLCGRLNGSMLPLRSIQSVEEERR